MSSKPRRRYGRSLQGGCWPTYRHELLLRAALLRDGRAVEAWKEWKPTFRLGEEFLDLGSSRLLPLLHVNLDSLGVKDELMGRLKGTYKLLWYRNSILFHKLNEVLSSLHNAGIKIMLLREAAMILTYYKDYGLRNMYDVDILVPPEQALSAADIIFKSGLNNKLDSSGHDFHIRERSLLVCTSKSPEYDFWGNSVTMVFRGVPVEVLRPTEQVFQICVHARSWAPAPVFEWIADIAAVFNVSHSEIDWDHMRVLTEKYRACPEILNVLSYVAELLDLPVPQAFLRSLRRMPVPSLRHWGYIVRSNGYGMSNDFASYLWFSGEEMSWLSVARNLPQYLKSRGRLKYSWQILFYIPLMALKLICRDFFKKKAQVCLP
jgi:hypothetical protein